MTIKIDGVAAPRPAPAPASAPATVPVIVERSGASRSEPVVEVQAADSGNVRLTEQGEALRAAQAQAKSEPAPIDQAKIMALRAALAAGTYRVNPQDIAKRLDALERELSR